MDLGAPLRSLIPSLDSAVLEVLARTESALSATQIARLASRGSRSGQLVVLNRLVEHGLVHASPTGRGYMYRLNRGHLLAPALLDAMEVRSVLFGRLSEAVGQMRPEPVSAFVFGSIARGDAGPGSDVDLAIIAPTDDAIDAWDAPLHDLADLVLEWTGNRLEPLAVTATKVDQLVKAGEAIVSEWANDAVHIHGTPLVELLHRTGRRPEQQAS